MGGSGPSGWAVLLLVLAAIVVLIAQLVLRRRKGPSPDVRPLEAFLTLRDELAQAAESGSAIHVALGSGGLTGEDALASVAALQVVDALVDNAVSYRVPFTISVGEPTLLPLAQDALRRAFERRGLAELYNPDWVRFIAPAPLPYAAGAAALVAEPAVATNIVAGALGAEVSLITEAGIRRDLSQSAAVASPAGAAALFPATERLALGEELFAAGAAMTGEPRYVAGLVTQDVLRVVVIVALVIGAVVAFVGTLGG